MASDNFYLQGPVRGLNAKPVMHRPVQNKPERKPEKKPGKSEGIIDYKALLQMDDIRAVSALYRFDESKEVLAPFQR